MCRGRRHPFVGRMEIGTLNTIPRQFVTGYRQDFESLTERFNVDKLGLSPSTWIALMVVAMNRYQRGHRFKSCTIQIT
jgi:hypothetical protein